MKLPFAGLGLIVVTGLLSVLADSDTSRLTVRVKAVDRLRVSDGGTINLEANPGNDHIGPVTDSTANLSYTHNKDTNQKIVAEAMAGDSPDPASNDITFKVSLGVESKILYSDSGVTGPQDIVTGLPAGALTDQSVNYTAECTSSGTPVTEDTDFNFMITFTSVDE
ncbi:MAG: hypothetical protein O3B01_16455 [Planctomycetota bacterium]|nr:hypothetical protein [Planctomycetota bacterium]